MDFSITPAILTIAIREIAMDKSFKKLLDRWSTNSVMMRVVGVDRQKFNEAIADGHYRVARDATPGTPRDFDGIDVLGIAAFGRLLDLGFSVRHAGNFASCVVEVLRGERPIAKGGEGKARPFFLGRSKDGSVAVFSRRPTAQERALFWVLIDLDIEAMAAEIGARFQRLKEVWDENTEPESISGRRKSRRPKKGVNINLDAEL
jgi:hypothetical protein